MRVLSVVGARPQFIKSAPVQRALREAGHHEFLVHTGQHYDFQMSQVFFDELDIGEPSVNLGIGSGPHGWQTGQMLIGLEKVIQEQQPDAVLVYGDTNSTLAGALAAAKLRVPLAHVEAGLRSFNREMPEEHNRVLTDHCADFLFCPTQSAVDLLAREGLTRGVHLVGDPMYDAVLQFADAARQRSRVLSDLSLEPRGYLLATIHRPYNTDVPEKLRNILSALGQLEDPVIFPVHPRTRQRLADLDGTGTIGANVRLIDPAGYLDMLVLEQNARMILTDSGGVQKEAYFFGVPCVTLRPETEWVETVQAGWNVLVGAEPERIVEAVLRRVWPQGTPPPVFGDGHASETLTRILGKG
jgi:UDP-N-acetylglucosamine 2-epimerase